jgi:hypothetical protein
VSELPPTIELTVTVPIEEVMRVVQQRHLGGFAAARRVAQWELGDPDYADMILKAYFSPETIPSIDEMDRQVTENP